MSVLVLNRVGGSVIVNVGDKTLVCDRLGLDREGANEVFQWLLRNVSVGFLERFSRLISDHQAEDTQELREALAADPRTNYLLTAP